MIALLAEVLTHAGIICAVVLVWQGVIAAAIRLS